MLLTSLRDSLRPDDLEIPPRPIAKAVQLGTRTLSDGTVSVLYRFALVQQYVTGRLIARRDFIDVAQLEIFACVQRQNNSQITRWRQIAQVALRKKEQRGPPERKPHDVDYVDGNGRNACSNTVKIAGFQPGFRYQIVVRAVDAHGKRSLFSQPVFVVPDNAP